MQSTLDLLQAIRDQLELADRDHIKERQIGHILIAIGTLTDLVEELARDLQAVGDRQE